MDNTRDMGAYLENSNRLGACAAVEAGEDGQAETGYSDDRGNQLVDPLITFIGDEEYGDTDHEADKEVPHVSVVVGADGRLHVKPGKDQSADNANERQKTAHPTDQLT